MAPSACCGVCGRYEVTTRDLLKYSSRTRGSLRDWFRCATLLLVLRRVDGMRVIIVAIEQSFSVNLGVSTPGMYICKVHVMHNITDVCTSQRVYSCRSWLSFLSAFSSLEY